MVARGKRTAFDGAIARRKMPYSQPPVGGNEHARCVDQSNG